MIIVTNESIKYFISSVISAYDSSSRNAVCTAITNAAYSGKDIIEELKKAEETVSFEMEQ